ncbi:hypothetical protein A5630_25405 [Mycolicibacterium mucogenicum]|uniref:Uncharacterized protein n=1 Tax=Mycolicibacterium mucogenicum TaxID=56689 RepID=A0A1A3GY44_MYCMU|nr:hypothetical protein [Mycolicibacterium mucogenicum]OBJ40291.1 hypothetical protein A5630_25405 [Mycolicibacterium mucogenicum]
MRFTTSVEVSKPEDVVEEALEETVEWCDRHGAPFDHVEAKHAVMRNLADAGFVIVHRGY